MSSKRDKKVFIRRKKTAYVFSDTDHSYEEDDDRFNNPNQLANNPFIPRKARDLIRTRAKINEQKKSSNKSGVKIIITSNSNNSSNFNEENGTSDQINSPLENDFKNLLKGSLNINFSAMKKKKFNITTKATNESITIKEFNLKIIHIFKEVYSHFYNIDENNNNNNNNSQVDWGLGIGDWGLGLGPIPNPQSPIPNPIPNPIVLLKKKLCFV